DRPANRRHHGRAHAPGDRRSSTRPLRAPAGPGISTRRPALHLVVPTAGLSPGRAHHVPRHLGRPAWEDAYPTAGLVVDAPGLRNTAGPRAARSPHPLTPGL